MEKKGDLSAFECGMGICARKAILVFADLLGLSHTTRLEQDQISSKR